MDAANVDLKAFTDGFYHASARPAQPVLETLDYLKHETDVWFEITTLSSRARTTATASSRR